MQLAFDDEARALQLGLDQLDFGDGEHEDSAISKLVCDGVQALGRLLLGCAKLMVAWQWNGLRLKLQAHQWSVSALSCM